MMSIESLSLQIIKHQQQLTEVAKRITVLESTPAAAVKQKGGGELYEDRVYNIVKSLHPSPFLVVLPKGKTSDNNSVDLPLQFCGMPLPIELKMKGAQMGGSSAHYDRATSTFTKLVKDLPDAELILSAAAVKIPALNAYIDAAKELEPSSEITGMPITLNKSTYTALGRRGLQAEAASEIEHPISFLSNFYNKKRIYYIQIEEHGFFSLGGNPFNFPIPELKGTFNLEFRIGPAGSGASSRRSAGYRIQGRLKGLNYSPFSLDDEDVCQALFDKDWRM